MGFLVGFTIGDGIAHLHLPGFLDARDEIAHVTGLNALSGKLGKLERAHFIGIIVFVGGDELYFLSFFDFSVDDPEIGLYAPERVNRPNRRRGPAKARLHCPLGAGCAR